MKQLVYFSLLLIIFLGCEVTQNNSYVQLAEVNGVTLSLDQALSNISDYELSYDSVGALIKYRDDWINSQLIEQEIERLELNADPEVKRKVDKAVKRVLEISFQEAVISTSQKNTTVTNEEARNYYQQNREQFVLNEKFIRFRHLIAPTFTTAQRAKTDLMQGIEWEEVARDHSINPTLAISNSKKFYPQSSALKEYSVLNRYLGLIGVSEISIIENINGQYHFVQLVEEKAEGEHPDLEWLLDQIKDWLILEKKRSAYNRYVKNLYLAAQANNEIKVSNVLPKKVTTQNESKSDSLNTN